VDFLDGGHTLVLDPYDVVIEFNSNFATRSTVVLEVQVLISSEILQISLLLGTVIRLNLISCLLRAFGPKV